MKARVRGAIAIALCGAACNTILGIDPLDDGADAGVDASLADVAEADDAAPSSDASIDASSDVTSDATNDAIEDAPADTAPPSCDVASIPDGQPCTTAPQCGCTPAQTCDYNGASSGPGLTCFAAGTSPLGGYCPIVFPSPRSCAPGLTCFSGVCHELCATIDASCGNGATCQAVLGATHGFNMCMKTSCDLADAASCGPSDASAPIGCAIADNVPHVDCLEMGTSRTSCQSGFDCAPGWGCNGTFSDGGGECTKWCRLGKSDCEGATTCHSVGTIAGVSWGECY